MENGPKDLSVSHILTHLGGSMGIGLGRLADCFLAAPLLASPRLRNPGNVFWEVPRSKGNPPYEGDKSSLESSSPEMRVLSAWIGRTQTSVAPHVPTATSVPGPFC